MVQKVDQHVAVFLAENTAADQENEHGEAVARVDGDAQVVQATYQVAQVVKISHSFSRLVRVQETVQVSVQALQEKSLRPYLHLRRHLDSARHQGHQCRHKLCYMSPSETK